MKKVYILVLAQLWAFTSFAQVIIGKWSGEIESGKKDPVVFVFTIEKIGEAYKTTIDIPAMRAVGLKPKETSFSNDTLFVNGSNLGFTYKGIFIHNTGQIQGTFTEGVNALPLSLKKEEIKIEPTFKRPQEPVKPYPYSEEEITFKNDKANVNLSGTLTLPQKEGKFPVVILISGSGPQDRDETFYEHKSFLVLADYLTRQGIAVLRYDDRGAGKSTGDHSIATTKDLASDVLSAVQYLKSRKDIDKIGLIGHSEGAIIAPMVANADKKIAFIVMLGGSGTAGSEVSLFLAKTQRGFPVSDEATYEIAIKKAIKIAASNKNVEEIKKELKQHYNKSIVPMIRPMFKTDEEVEVVVNKLIETRTSTWSRYFYNYNPADELAKIVCPVLALNGSKDTQVEPKINQQGIRNALIQGHNKDYLVKELPNLNHLFQECKTGQMNEYSLIEETISPFVLKQVSEWILVKAK
jgi:pimeloyl-ACP methyl ester carboxylesterase